MFKPLRQEIRYNLMLDVVEDVKQIGGGRFVHKLKFRDSRGVWYLADYINRTSTQEEFLPGKRTAFKVITVSDKNPEIVPTPEYNQQEEFEIIAQFLPPITGTTYLHALNAAVSLMNTESQNKLLEYDDTRIKKLLDIADTIDTWLVGQQADRILESL